jgi:hypothetical protein
VRAGAVAVVLAVVGAATLLNLVLGAVWAVAVIGLAVLRRRFRPVAWLALVVTAGAAALAWRLGATAPPPPASYEVSEVSWLLGHVPGSLNLGRGRDGVGGTAAEARSRLAARRREELAYAVEDLERRASTAVLASRRLERLRERAPAEVAAVEAAVRQLALTFTAPEFGDLETRRARLVAWLDELDVRLRLARDETDRAAVARALEPAAMAAVSFRALYEDVARVDAATRALVRAVAGREPSVASTARVAYDEPAGQLVLEERYVLDIPPALVVRRLDVGALRRRAVRQGDAHTLQYATGGGEPRAFTGTDLELPGPAAQVVVTDRRTRAATLTAIRPSLRPIPFQRLVIDRLADEPVELRVGVALEGPSGVEAVTPVIPPPSRFLGLVLPRDAFHWATLPGTVERNGGDVWLPSLPEAVPTILGVELVPPGRLFRNAGYGAVRRYLYVPNLTATLTLVGLAAVTSLLARRRRATGPVPEAGR